ncbi:hypothetical protein, partial [Neisseria mucosa]|uniref:hypothetical protein n=1 Tax=Neisseria mucosa TaxID=488 RepID=UPI00197E585C
SNFVNRLFLQRSHYLNLLHLTENGLLLRSLFNTAPLLFLVLRCLYGLWLGCFAASNAICFLNSCHINAEMLYNNKLSKYDEKLK